MYPSIIIKSQLAILIAATLLLTSCQRKDEVYKGKPAGCATDSIATDNNDILFATMATEVNLEQINLGKLAQKNGSISEVISLGKNMKNVYTVAQRQLKTIPKLESVNLPEEMNFDGKDSYEKLMVKNGPDFDKQFSEIIVDQDEKAISQFEKQMVKIQDKNLKEWAGYVLPLLKTDLTNAEKCEKLTEK